MTVDEDIKNACDVMRRGGLILYPTDTVWGIGCDATRSSAVRRVFDLKQRADHKALIVLIDNADNLWRYVDNEPEIAYDLIDVSVNPLTIVFDHGRGVAPELLGPDGSIGVRVTRETVSQRLCRAMKCPIVSTSANIAGKPTPAIFREISPEIIEGVDYVMQSRRNDDARHAPSSVIKLSNDGAVKILRK